jgi:hypothetical protein
MMSPTLSPIVAIPRNDFGLLPQGPFLFDLLSPWELALFP